MFFEKIDVEGKDIVKATYTPLFQNLVDVKGVRIASNLLENRNSNITTQLACIIKAFSDFRLVAQIREEIEKVNSIYCVT